MNFLQRRRARFLIKRAQPFADEALLAVANFTWVGNSMGAQPRVRGRGDWAGGLPDWTLIGAGGTRLFVIAAHRARTHARPVLCRWVPGAQYVSSFPTAKPPCCNHPHARWTTCCRHTERHNLQVARAACARTRSPRSR